MPSVVPANRDESKPRRVGQYEILAELGRGGMGTVFKARHLALNKLVALKTLPPERMTDAAVARFRREMEAAGRLTHPLVVRATDAGEADGVHYLAMDYVEGADVGRVLRRAGPLPVADACAIARQAAEALTAVEAAGLVHRDVKPSNLMLAADGSVRLLDLGLARLADAADPITASGVTMGTADFVAPEQIRDSHSVDAKADVYSLGCTLYALLSGRPPFGGVETFASKINAHLHETVPPVETVRGGIPAEVARLVARMLAKDPRGRPTAAEVRDALTAPAAGNDLATLSGASIGEAESDSPYVDESDRRTPAGAHDSTRPHERPSVPPAVPPGRSWWRPAVAIALAGAVALAAWALRHAERRRPAGGGTEPERGPAGAARIPPRRVGRSARPGAAQSARNPRGPTSFSIRSGTTPRTASCTSGRGSARSSNWPTWGKRTSSSK